MLMKHRHPSSLLLVGLLLLRGYPALCQEAEKPRADSTTSNVPKMEEVETYLGVAVEMLHPAFRLHLRDLLETKQGLLVAHVAKGSPAEKAGIKEHDILMMFGDQKLFAVEQLVALVHAAKNNQKVKISLVRSGKTEMIEVTLSEHSVGVTSPHSAFPRDFAQRLLRRRPGNTRWETFDSMSIKSLGDGHFRVEISYETKAGKIEHKTFEGTLEAIHEKIAAQKDLPADEREHLLRALDRPLDDIPFDLPEILMMPEGRPIIAIPQTQVIPKRLFLQDF